MARAPLLHPFMHDQAEGTKVRRAASTSRQANSPSIVLLQSLQRSAGNRAVNGLLRSMRLQRQDDGGAGTALAEPPATAEVIPAEAFPEELSAAPGTADPDASGSTEGGSESGLAPATGGGESLDVSGPAPATAIPSRTREAVIPGVSSSGLAGPLGPGSEAPPLSAAKIGMARSFYASSPGHYTPAIIQQIQGKVATTPTGVMDDATILGVATFQGLNQPLKIDGMAGVRTLPVMFPTGLAAKANVDQYVKDAKAVAAGWAGLGTAEARADALMGAVSTELTAAQVVVPQHEVKDLGAAVGDFHHSTTAWIMHLDRAAFAAPTIDDDDAASVAGTVYHESRHAEQFHKRAGMRAAKGSDADAISNEVGVPPEVAADAKSKPLAPGTTEFIIAEEQFKSEFGSERAATQQAEADVAAKKQAWDDAKQALKDNPTPENEAKEKQAMRAFAKANLRYRNLPVESDAFQVEGMVADTWIDPPAP